MKNLKAEFHKHLTRLDVKHDQEMSMVFLLESDLKMCKSNANVVSFDEDTSYWSTFMNLYEWKEQILMNETTIENRTNIGTIKSYCNFIFFI